jgi:hypothetical protein
MIAFVGCGQHLVASASTPSHWTLCHVIYVQAMPLSWYAQLATTCVVLCSAHASCWLLDVAEVTHQLPQHLPFSLPCLLELSGFVSKVSMHSHWSCNTMYMSCDVHELQWADARLQCCAAVATTKEYMHKQELQHCYSGGMCTCPAAHSHGSHATKHAYMCYTCSTGFMSSMCMPYLLLLCSAALTGMLATVEAARLGLMSVAAAADDALGSISCFSRLTSATVADGLVKK